jgi:hypothetical protein
MSASQPLPQAHLLQRGSSTFVLHQTGEAGGAVKKRLGGDIVIYPSTKKYEGALEVEDLPGAGAWGGGQNYSMEVEV